MSTYLKKLVDSSRLSRAKRITDKSLIEFEILNEDPIVVYSIIKGSAPEPYVVIIDCKDKLLGHWCPDFRPSRWCKHVGKVLLKLPDSALKQVFNNKMSFRFTRDREKLKQKVKELKEEYLIKEETADASVSLWEYIDLAVNNLMKGNKDSKVVIDLEAKLETEMPINKPLELMFVLRRIIFSQKTAKRKELFIDRYRDILLRHFNTIITDFLKSFWIKHDTIILSRAYTISELAQLFQVEIPYNEILKVPKDINHEELKLYYPTIVLLFGEKTEITKKILESWQLNLSDNEKSHIFREMVERIAFTGTESEGIERWLKLKVSQLLPQFSQSSSADDFFIYVMEMANQRPEYKLYFNYNEVAFISGSLLNDYPALEYVISKIKQSEREYITEDEYYHHKKFFTWLKGEHIKHNWVELPRKRQPDTYLTTQAIIIQWDINSNIYSADFLETVDKGRRIIVDRSSPLYGKIQPFDYTLCNPSLKPIDEYTASAYPTVILMPDQVIKLVKLGVPIISNVLPWNVLAKFQRGEYVDSGEIIKAGIECSKRSFVFGAYELEKELKGYLTLTVKGVKPEDYMEYHKQLKNDTGRLNALSREICRQILYSEGEELETVLKSIGAYNDLRLILKIAREKPTIKEFRVAMIRYVLEEAIKGNVRTDIFQLMKKLEKTKYSSFATKVFKDMLIEWYKNLKKMLSQEKITRNKIYKNILGRLIMQELNISKYGNLRLEEKEVINKKLKSIAHIFR